MKSQISNFKSAAAAALDAISDHLEFLEAEYPRTVGEINKQISLLEQIMTSIGLTMEAAADVINSQAAQISQLQQENTSLQQQVTALQAQPTLDAQDQTQEAALAAIPAVAAQIQTLQSAQTQNPSTAGAGSNPAPATAGPTTA